MNPKSVTFAGWNPATTERKGPMRTIKILMTIELEIDPSETTMFDVKRDLIPITDEISNVIGVIGMNRTVYESLD